MGSLRTLHKDRKIDDYEDEFLEWLRGPNPNYDDYRTVELVGNFGEFVQFSFPCHGDVIPDYDACKLCPDYRGCCVMRERHWWYEVEYGGMTEQDYIVEYCGDEEDREIPV